MKKIFLILFSLITFTSCAQNVIIGSGTTPRPTVNGTYSLKFNGGRLQLIPATGPAINVKMHADSLVKFYNVIGLIDSLSGYVSKSKVDTITSQKIFTNQSGVSNYRVGVGGGDNLRIGGSDGESYIDVLQDVGSVQVVSNRNGGLNGFYSYGNNSSIEMLTTGNNSKIRMNANAPGSLVVIEGQELPIIGIRSTERSFRYSKTNSETYNGYDFDIDGTFRTTRPAKFDSSITMAKGVLPTHAIRKDQLDSLGSTKSNASHVHIISDVTGLQTALNTHTSDITTINNNIASSKTSRYAFIAPNGGGLPAWRQLEVADIPGLSSYSIIRDNPNIWNQNITVLTDTTYGVKIANVFPSTNVSTGKTSPTLRIMSTAWNTGSGGFSQQVGWGFKTIGNGGSTTTSSTLHLMSYTSASPTGTSVLSINGNTNHMSSTGRMEASDFWTAGHFRSETSSIGSAIGGSAVYSFTSTNATNGTRVQTPKGLLFSGYVWDTGASASRQIYNTIKPMYVDGNPGYSRMGFYSSYNSTTAASVEIGSIGDRGIVPNKVTQSVRDSWGSNVTDGAIIICTDCVMTDTSIGGAQMYQTSTTSWKNLF